MKNIEITKEQILLANTTIFEKWLDEELVRKMAKPASNLEILKVILLNGQRNSEEVELLTVGCQPMDDVSISNGEKMSVVSTISTKSNSRPARWAQGIAGFQMALKSLGVNTKLFLSLSDIQLLAQKIDSPQNADLVDVERIEDNVTRITAMINDNGGNVTPFSHSQTLMHGCKAQDLETLIKILLPQWQGERLTHILNDNSVDPLAAALYDADPSILPVQLLGGAPSNLIWLDMMSDLAEQDNLLLQKSIARNLPITPLIAPVSNGGNWSAAGEPVTKFRNKMEFVSLLLGLESFDFENREQWLVRIQNTISDDILIGFLSSVGIDMDISDTASRSNSIRVLESIVFGDASFNISKVKEVPFSENRLKNLIAQTNNISAKQALIQINQGVVKVNGNVVQDMNFIPQPNDVITIGRKTTIRII